MSYNKVPISELVIRANTGLDAIRRAPIVEEDTGIKCLRIQDISQKKSFNNWGNTKVLEKDFVKFQLKPNYIIIARTGASIGVARFIKDRLDSVFNNGLIRIEPNEEKVNPKYLFYNLVSQEYRNHIYGVSAGTATQPNMKMKDLLRYEISYPTLSEQKAIANILSSLDDKIELNNKINKNLEEMAQALYKQWFVDFEFPNEDGETYKSSGGEMIESELGLIPKGWEVKEIGEICTIQNGFAFKAPEYTSSGIKVIRTLNIGNDGYFNLNKITYLPDSYKNDKFSKYLFEKFDIALVMVGASIGKIGLALSNIVGSLQNQNMWRFRSNSNSINQIYLYYLVKYAQQLSSGWSTGSARDFYRKSSFSKIKVVVPNTSVNCSFGLIVGTLFKRIDNNFSESINLRRQRESLLPKLMSGEIEVPIKG